MQNYSSRKTAIYIVLLIVWLVYISKLFYIQIVDDSYERKAMKISQRMKIQYPARGLIFDRNNKLLVENQSAYDLLVTPRLVKDFDTTELVNILGISKEYLIKRLDKCRRYSPYRVSILFSQIPSAKFAKLEDKLYKYTGFDTQTRTLRKYDIHHSGDVFGYVSEINQAGIDRDSENYYSPGDYIGKNGLEKSYEKELRGVKGQSILLVDNHNRVQGPYKNGKFDKPAVVGKNLICTLDSKLQEYAYSLMKNKKGAIVAIEPSTGEILVKVSSPGYDPSLMLGLERGKNYNMLRDDPNIPLFDRTIMAAYPPGSTFKIIQALIGLQDGIITPKTKFTCNGGAIFAGRHLNCHHHISPLNLIQGIQHSCNPYFANVWERILNNKKYSNVREAYGDWRKTVQGFGIGKKISYEFSNAVSGLVPTQERYDRQFRTKRWAWSYIMSLAIGQGELLLSPLHIANMACIVANRGYYIAPHIVRTETANDSLLKKHYVKIDKQNFEPVIRGMELAVSDGTAKKAAIDSVIVCGKTGTAQNPHGEDHSIFMAFAPKYNPKIVISVYIENGGFGAAYAVPIGGLIMEKYLKGYISEERRYLEEEMINANLIDKK